MAQFLTFRLDQQNYGVPIATVREINRLTDITPVPQMPNYIAGVMNLRGKVIPVVDLRKKFEITCSPFTKHTCIIVVETLNGLVGTIVDSVSGVVDLLAEQIEANPAVTADSAGSHFQGVGKLESGIVILIDIVNAVKADGTLHLNSEKAKSQAA